MCQRSSLLSTDSYLIIYENSKWSGNLSKKQLLQKPIIIFPGIEMQILQNYSALYFTKKFRKF